MEPISERRKKLHESLRNFFESGKIKVASEIPDDGVIVVTRVEDFDMSSNDVWSLSANKSYPRDIYCGCGKQVVMSDGMLAMWERNGRKAKVICTREMEEYAKSVEN